MSRPQTPTQIDERTGRARAKVFPATVSQPLRPLSASSSRDNGIAGAANTLKRPASVPADQRRSHSTPPLSASPSPSNRGRSTRALVEAKSSSRKQPRICNTPACQRDITQTPEGAWFCEHCTGFLPEEERQQQIWRINTARYRETPKGSSAYEAIKAHKRTKEGQQHQQFLNKRTNLRTTLESLKQTTIYTAEGLSKQWDKLDSRHLAFEKEENERYPLDTSEERDARERQRESQAKERQRLRKASLDYLATPEAVAAHKAAVDSHNAKRQATRAAKVAAGSSTQSITQPKASASSSKKGKRAA